MLNARRISATATQLVDERIVAGDSFELTGGFTATRSMDGLPSFPAGAGLGSTMVPISSRTMVGGSAFYFHVRQPGGAEIIRQNARLCHTILATGGNSLRHKLQADSAVQKVDHDLFISHKNRWRWDEKPPRASGSAPTLGNDTGEYRCQFLWEDSRLRSPLFRNPGAARYRPRRQWRDLPQNQSENPVRMTISLRLGSLDSGGVCCTQ